LTAPRVVRLLVKTQEAMTTEADVCRGPHGTGAARASWTHGTRGGNSSHASLITERTKILLLAARIIKLVSQQKSSVLLLLLYAHRHRSIRGGWSHYTDTSVCAHNKYRLTFLFHFHFIQETFCKKIVTRQFDNKANKNPLPAHIIHVNLVSQQKSSVHIINTDWRFFFTSTLLKKHFVKKLVTCQFDNKANKNPFPAHIISSLGLVNTEINVFSLPLPQETFCEETLHMPVWYFTKRIKILG
jgi:hypothetical protein